MNITPSVIAALLAVCGEDPRVGGPSPFDAADRAPRDVEVYLHVEDAAGLRREFGERPIAGWIRARLADGDILRAWDLLAREAEIDPEQLFDLALGRSFTVLVRSEARDEAAGAPTTPSQWSLLSRVPAEESRRLLRGWRTKSLGPRHGMAIHELPEHEIILAAGADLLVAGPVDHSALFNEVLKCIESPMPERTLQSDSAIALAGELGPGRVGLFARHDQPLGGWSAAVSELRGDEVLIRHFARFDHPPFSAPIAGASFDLSPLEALQEHAIIAIAEPAEAGDGLLGTFISMHFPIMTPELHARIGARRLLVLGESDSRRLEPPSDVLVPTVARCYELKDASGAAVAADSAMLGCIEHLNDAGGGAYHIAAPPLTAPSDQPRSADVGAAAKALLHGLPIAEHVSLNWQITGGEHGDWFVVASDPHLLLDVTRALQAEPPTDEPSPKAAWASAGIVHGPRVAQHVRSWVNLPGLIADADQMAELRTAIEPLTELGDCLRSTRWCLTRPTVDTMRLELSIILAGSDSTQPDPSVR